MFFPVEKPNFHPTFPLPQKLKKTAVITFSAVFSHSKFYPDFRPATSAGLAFTFAFWREVQRVSAAATRQALCKRQHKIKPVKISVSVPLPRALLRPQAAALPKVPCNRQPTKSICASYTPADSFKICLCCVQNFLRSFSFKVSCKPVYRNLRRFIGLLSITILDTREKVKLLLSVVVVPRRLQVLSLTATNSFLHCVSSEPQLYPGFQKLPTVFARAKKERRRRFWKVYGGLKRIKIA